MLILDDTNDNISENEMLRTPFQNNPSASKKYRTLEQELHRKILQQRTHELSVLSTKSRKNASLLRRKKSESNKKFEPIQLQNDINLNDDDDNNMDDIDEALPINPNGITLPLIVDDSEPNYHFDESHSYNNNKTRKTGSNSHISILSGEHDRGHGHCYIFHGIQNTLSNHGEGRTTDDTDTDTDSEEDTDDGEVIIVCNEDGNNDTIILDANDCDEKEEKQIKENSDDSNIDSSQHKNNILEALQNAIQKQTDQEKVKNGSITRSHRDITMASNNDITTTTTSSNVTTSGSNVSSLFDSVDSDDSDNEISSDCFHLFKDDDGYTPSMDQDDEKINTKQLKPKYSVKVPLIKIPKSEKDLLKKVKPAYKWHLEMIDDDGSITYQIEQRKKRREREKQQQQMKQLYSRQNNNTGSGYNNRNHGRNLYHKGHGTNNLHSHFDSECHRKRSKNGDMPLSRKQNRNYIRMLYFQSKPLGFQINESPESIFVTNVYSDRGSAFEKGVEKGWKIVEVNKHETVIGMMNELRNNNGPFNITFDTIAGNQNYHYS